MGFVLLRARFDMKLTAIHVGVPFLKVGGGDGAGDQEHRGLPSNKVNVTRGARKQRSEDDRMSGAEEAPRVDSFTGGAPLF